MHRGMWLAVRTAVNVGPSAEWAQNSEAAFLRAGLLLLPDVAHALPVRDALPSLRMA